MSLRHFDYLKLKCSKFLAAEIRPIRCLVDTPNGTVRTTKWMTYDHWKELRLLLNEIVDQYEEQKQNLLFQSVKCNEYRLKNGNLIKIGYMFVPYSACHCHFLVPRDDVVWTDDDDVDDSNAEFSDKGGRYRTLSPAEEMLVVSIRLQEQKTDAVRSTGVPQSPVTADKNLVKALDRSFVITNTISDYFPLSQKHPSDSDQVSESSLSSLTGKFNRHKKNTVKFVTAKMQRKHEKRKRDKVLENMKQKHRKLACDSSGNQVFDDCSIDHSLGKDENLEYKDRDSQEEVDDAWKNLDDTKDIPVFEANLSTIMEIPLYEANLSPRNEAREPISETENITCVRKKHMQIFDGSVPDSSKIVKGAEENSSGLNQPFPKESTLSLCALMNTPRKYENVNAKLRDLFEMSSEDTKERECSTLLLDSDVEYKPSTFGLQPSRIEGEVAENNNDHICRRSKRIMNRLPVLSGGRSFLHNPETNIPEKKAGVFESVTSDVIKSANPIEYEVKNSKNNEMKPTNINKNQNVSKSRKDNTKACLDSILSCSNTKLFDSKYVRINELCREEKEIKNTELESSAKGKRKESKTSTGNRRKKKRLTSRKCRGIGVSEASSFSYSGPHDYLSEEHSTLCTGYGEFFSDKRLIKNHERANTLALIRPTLPSSSLDLQGDSPSSSSKAPGLNSSPQQYTVKDSNKSKSKSLLRRQRYKMKKANKIVLEVEKLIAEGKKLLGEPLPFDFSQSPTSSEDKMHNPSSIIEEEKSLAYFKYKDGDCKTAPVMATHECCSDIENKRVAKGMSDIKGSISNKESTTTYEMGFSKWLTANKQEDFISSKCSSNMSKTKVVKVTAKKKKYITQVMTDNKFSTDKTNKECSTQEMADNKCIVNKKNKVIAPQVMKDSMISTCKKKTEIITPLTADIKYCTDKRKTAVTKQGKADGKCFTNRKTNNVITKVTTASKCSAVKKRNKCNTSAQKKNTDIILNVQTGRKKTKIDLAPNQPTLKDCLLLKSLKTVSEKKSSPRKKQRRNIIEHGLSVENLSFLDDKANLNGVECQHELENTQLILNFSVEPQENSTGNEISFRKESKVMDIRHSSSSLMSDNCPTIGSDHNFEIKYNDTNEEIAISSVEKSTKKCAEESTLNFQSQLTTSNDGNSSCIILEEKSKAISLEDLQFIYSKLVNTTLKEMKDRLISCDNYFCSIIEGKKHNVRHEVFKKNYCRDFFSELVYGPFSEEQIEFVTQYLKDNYIRILMETKYDLDTSRKYVWKVLGPSFFIKLVMDNEDCDELLSEKILQDISLKVMM